MGYEEAVRAAAVLMIASAIPAQAQDVLDRVGRETVRPQDAVKDGPADRATPSRPKVSITVDAPRPSDAGTAGSVMVGAVVLKGLKALTPADFADIVRDHVGRPLAPDELSALAGAISERARGRGYVFASAWIVPQKLDAGILSVQVDEGRIDEIRIEGGENAAVRRALAPLLDGKPARLKDVERRLLIAGDVDSVWVRSSRFLREGERGVLLVVLGHQRHAGRIAIANDGTGPLGPVRVRVDADLNALLFSDDAFSVTYNGTPGQPRELNYVRARYGKRIDRNGTEIAISGSVSRARPGGDIKYLGIDSRSWFASFGMLRPLQRSRQSSLWLEAELGVRNLVQRRNGALFRHDRITAARLTLNGNTAFAGGRLRTSATVSQGLDLFGATRAGDPLASRRDANGTFTTVDIWTDWTRPLGGDFSVRLAAQTLWSSGPLLVSEEFGLGGTAFLRAYDWGERSGDAGTMGSAELRYDWDRPFNSMRDAQFYAFVDGGKAIELGGGDDGSTLASAGGGFRAGITRTIKANLEVAVPLTGPRYDTGDKDPRMRFGVAKSF